MGREHQVDQKKRRLLIEFAALGATTAIGLGTGGAAVLNGCKQATGGMNEAHANIESGPTRTIFGLETMAIGAACIFWTVNGFRNAFKRI